MLPAAEEGRYVMADKPNPPEPVTTFEEVDNGLVVHYPDNPSIYFPSMGFRGPKGPALTPKKERKPRMAFPANRVEMVERGYSLFERTTCRGCSVPMEFWNTPNGHKMPMNPMPDDHTAAVSHYATCPDANSFRKKK